MTIERETLTMGNTKSNGKEMINNVNVDIDTRIPELNDWVPTDDQTYYVFDNDVVIARYDKYLGLQSDSKLRLFIIEKKHYRDRMESICNMINYFLNFFDEEKELFHS